MSAPMFPVLGEMLGKAVAAGQPEPEAPVAVNDPTDETAGPYPAKLPTVEPPDDPVDSAPLRVPPVPLIGSVPLGAVVVDARTHAQAAGVVEYLQLGENVGARPGILGVIVYKVSGAGSATIVGRKADLHAGFTLGGVPFFYPLRSALVKVDGEVTVAYMVLGSDLGPV